MMERRRELDRQLDEFTASFGGELALYVKNLGTGEVIARNADAIFPTASCIMVFILLELMRRVAVGEFALQQTIPVLPEQQVGGSGVLKDLTAGTMLPLRDVATLMIVLSDNTATNMLIDLLSLAAINATIRNLGLQHTRLISKVDFEAIGSDVTRFAVSTAREFAPAVSRPAPAMPPLQSLRARAEAAAGSACGEQDGLLLGGSLRHGVVVPTSIHTGRSRTHHGLPRSEFLR